VGGWRRRLERQRVLITVHLLTPLKVSERHALAGAAAGYGEFLGMPVVLDGAQV
jgi:hypothetical protein